MSLWSRTKLNDIGDLPWIHLKSSPGKMPKCSYILDDIFIISDDFLGKFCDFRHDIIICFFKSLHSRQVDIFRIVISVDSSHSLGYLLCCSVSLDITICSKIHQKFDQQACVLECSWHPIVSSSIPQCCIHDGFFLIERHSFGHSQGLRIADSTL